MGGSMIAPFDIFRVDAPDDMLYVEAAADIETAKARVAALMQDKPCEYLIFSQKTGNKISIKPTTASSDSDSR
jgi:hypothetical protein